MDLESFLDHKVALLHSILERPGMHASTAKEMEATLRPLLFDLALLRDQPTSGDLWKVVSHDRYDEYGLAGQSRWFREPERRCVEEIAAQYAQLATRLGLLEISERVSPEDWSAWDLDTAGTYRDRDWTRGELPAPSLVVGRRVWCYAPVDPTAEWVYLDFPAWDGPDDSEQLLRDVRLPRDRAVHGLIFTPSGREFDDRWAGELHADIAFLTEAQGRAVLSAAVELVRSEHPVDHPGIDTALAAIKTGAGRAAALAELAELEAHVRAEPDPGGHPFHGRLSTVLIAQTALTGSPHDGLIEAMKSAYFSLIDCAPESVAALRSMIIDPVEHES